MSIVDDQVRRATIALLRDMAEWVESGEALIERYNGFAFVMHKDARWRDEKTQQELHAIVYVGLSEDPAPIARAASVLGGDDPQTRASPE